MNLLNRNFKYHPSASHFSSKAFAKRQEQRKRIAQQKERKNG